MPIIDLNAALELNKISQGMVYINDYPVIRTGKKSDFMIGNFINQDQEVEFRIWEPEIFKPVVANGPGIYDAEVVGNSFNDKVYLTVRSIAPSLSQNIKKSDFLLNPPHHTGRKLAAGSGAAVPDRCQRRLLGFA